MPKQCNRRMLDKQVLSFLHLVASGHHRNCASGTNCRCNSNVLWWAEEVACDAHELLELIAAEQNRLALSS